MDKQADVFAELWKIFKRGLIGMGKTKAAIEFQVVSAFNKQTPLPPWRDHLYIVTLVTPARLLPPDIQLQGANSHVELKKLYARYWREQHGGIILETYYAQQQPMGVYYFHRKQLHHEQRLGFDYRPEWLTVAGSVFVLRVSDPEALEKLTIWQKTGLPAINNIDGSEVDWRTSPYLPEHGYGEITVNYPDQVSLLFESEKVTA